jgi:hypothetical protein
MTDAERIVSLANEYCDKDGYVRVGMIAYITQIPGIVVENVLTKKEHKFVKHYEGIFVKEPEHT